MTITADDIIDALPNLSNDDKLRVLAAARLATGRANTLVTQVTGPGSPTHTDNQRRLYRAIVGCCRSKELPCPPNLTVLANVTRLAKLFDTNSEIFIQFVDKNFETRDRFKTLSIYHRLLGFIVLYLNNNNIIISPKTLIEQLKNIPSIIEISFPGYAASGMLDAAISTRPKTKRRSV